MYQVHELLESGNGRLGFLITAAKGPVSQVEILRIYKYVCVYIYIYVYIGTSMYMCVYVCIYTNIYIYIYIYIHTYVHI